MMSSSPRAVLHHAGALDAPVMRAWLLEDLGIAPPPAAPAAWGGARREREQCAAADAAQLADDAADRLRRAAEAVEVERGAALMAEFDRGFEDGREEGERAEGARLRTAAHAAEAALAELRERDEKWTATMEPNIAALAVAIARQLVGRELAADGEIVTGLVKAALAEFPIDQTVRLRVHPGDLETLTSTDAHLSLVEGRQASWIADATLTPGSCLVEGRDRIIDGRVDTALERLYRRMSYDNE
jgi:flagellar biosynthesis/type III secretory pathway protein FliH